MGASVSTVDVSVSEADTSMNRVSSTHVSPVWANVSDVGSTDECMTTLYTEFLLQNHRGRSLCFQNEPNPDIFKDCYESAIDPSLVQVKASLMLTAPPRCIERLDNMYLNKVYYEKTRADVDGRYINNSVKITLEADGKLYPVIRQDVSLYDCPTLLNIKIGDDTYPITITANFNNKFLSSPTPPLIRPLNFRDHPEDKAIVGTNSHDVARGWRAILMKKPSDEQLKGLFKDPPFLSPMSGHDDPEEKMFDIREELYLTVQGPIGDVKFALESIEKPLEKEFKANVIIIESKPGQANCLSRTISVKSSTDNNKKVTLRNGGTLVFSLKVEYHGKRISDSASTVSPAWVSVSDL